MEYVIPIRSCVFIVKAIHCFPHDWMKDRNFVGTLEERR